MQEKKVIVGAYNNGYKTKVYTARDFSLATIRQGNFYYAKSVIYFSLIEGDKIKATVFLKNTLPPEIYYNMIGRPNPNPLSMGPINFELKDLPDFLHPIAISEFDKDYYYDLENRVNPNYAELEKAFLRYANQTIPLLKVSNSEEYNDIFTEHSFNFTKYNINTYDDILRFLKAFEYNNPTLKEFVSNYRMFSIYKHLIDSLEEETPSKPRA